MADRKTPVRLLLIGVAVGCAILGGLTLAGRGPLVAPVSPSEDWRSPTRYAEQADNPLPRRDLQQMVPDQFDAVTTPKKLIGTQVASIVVRPDRVDQMVGSTIVWSRPYRSMPGFTGRLTLASLTDLLAQSRHPDWLHRTDPGVYLLSAGLVQAPGTELWITGPEVTDLRLASQPYVYVAGVGARAVFENVRVTSLLPSGQGGPATDPAQRRPFISYDGGGRLDIINSRMSYLGTDSSRGYGVSWGAGTTGQAIGSVFHHNLFGAYTGGSVGVVFRSNVFGDNARYGLDPHTGSSGLMVIDNEAYGNNSHGIIFSERVNHSLVQGNRSHDNGANGIMMDERSDFNAVRDNQVWNNRGDGIVLQGSSHTVVSGNRISGNSVGVRINANRLGPTDGTRVARNEISGNRNGIQVYGGARDTVTTGNQITDTGDQAIHLIDPAASSYDTVSGALKAVMVDRKATIEGLNATDVGRSVVVGEGAQVTVQASRLTGRDIAVEVQQGSHLDLAGTDFGTPTTISGARKGVVVDGTVNLRNVAIQEVERGVLVGGNGRATIDTTAIATDSKGVEVRGLDGQERVLLTATDVRSRQPLVGGTLWEQSGNKLTALPSWLALAGALFVLLAAVLQIAEHVHLPRWILRGHRHHPTAGAG